MDTYVGFDSAWTDNPKQLGAICALSIEGGSPVRFHAPRLVSFNEALTFIRPLHAESSTTLIALDQPTMVPNSAGMRPVERVAASLISWMGGGVQPSNRGKVGMFCDAAPIWLFLEKLAAVQDPERARVAASGLYLMEVFPALALPTLDAGFMQRLGAPKYNPSAKRKFRLEHWVKVAEAAAQEAQALGYKELAEWCSDAGRIAQPRKPNQDMMDSALCLLVALRWRLRPRSESLFLGDLTTGYMVLPSSAAVREYLTIAARKHSVQIDGVIPIQGNELKLEATGINPHQLTA
jgi:predicted RNase H-like nuclease